MELVVGICDDEAIQVDAISSFLEKYIKNYQLKLVKAYSGEEFLVKLEDTEPDVVFLDIEMKNLNGLQTGKRIRERYPEVIIIFITGYKKFALDAFKIKTMDYLIKPVTENRMHALIRDLMIRLEQIRSYKVKNKSVSFSFRDNIINLKYSEIYFFEKSLRKITVYSDKGHFSFYESMQELINRLDMDQFVHCHNSYIINKAKILEMNNDGIYIREFDKSIPVSRKNKQLVREALENNLFN